jgi:hypothetical protein
MSISAILEGVEVLAKAYPSAGRPDRSTVPVADALAALNAFSDIVRYLNTRRSKAATLDLSDEAAVQDALFLMLRPFDCRPHS